MPTKLFFFFNDTATTEIYTLSLHDALPICSPFFARWKQTTWPGSGPLLILSMTRSEEHTSELQSHLNLVCRLLLEKKKKIARTDEGSDRRRKQDQQAATASRHGLPQHDTST